jgi:16S rRNA (cytosine967-C5)-methyltransferase
LRIPASAAVNESVNLVRAAKLSSAASLVNAVLRRATREPDYDPAASVIDADEKLAIESSHPKWLVRRWANAFGFEEAKSLAHANNQAAPLAFRLTARALEDEDAEEKIIKDLEADGVRVSPSRIVPESWRVDRYRTARGSDSVRTRSGSDGIKH